MVKEQFDLKCVISKEQQAKAKKNKEQQAKAKKNMFNNYFLYYYNLLIHI